MKLVHVFPYTSQYIFPYVSLLQAPIKSKHIQERSWNNGTSNILKI